MKRKKLLYGLFVLFVLSIFLPWFTFNAKMMGYCWGYSFLKWLVVPVVIILLYLFQERSKMFAILSELSLVSILMTYVVAFGRWQEVFHIVPGFQWDEGFYTATAGYWIPVLLFIVFSIVMQFVLF